MATKNHQRSHTIENTFVHDQCEKIYNRIDHRARHKFLHIGWRAFACYQCEKTFSHSCNLGEHKLTHSGHKPYLSKSHLLVYWYQGCGSVCVLWMNLVLDFFLNIFLSCFLILLIFALVLYPIFSLVIVLFGQTWSLSSYLFSLVYSIVLNIVTYHKIIYTLLIYNLWLESPRDSR